MDEFRITSSRNLSKEKTIGIFLSRGGLLALFAFLLYFLFFINVVPLTISVVTLAILFLLGCIGIMFGPNYVENAEYLLNIYLRDEFLILEKVYETNKAENIEIEWNKI